MVLVWTNFAIVVQSEENLKMHTDVSDLVLHKKPLYQQKNHYKQSQKHNNATKMFDKTTFAGRPQTVSFAFNQLVWLTGKVPHSFHSPH